MQFKDRREAGTLLAALLREKRVKFDVVLGVARGGVVVAHQVASELGAELGAIAVRKIAAPWNPEFSVGAVACGVFAFVDRGLAHEFRVGTDEILAESERLQRECARQDADFARFGRPRLRGRPVLIVDDALVTGASAVAAIRRARLLGAWPITLAAPVASPAALGRVVEEGVRTHCLALEPGLASPADCYENLEVVDEGAVCRLLAQFHDARPITSRHVTIPAGDATLSAILELPEGAGPFPAVLLVHGADEHKDSARITSLASRLRQRGIATLRFDSKACRSGTLPLLREAGPCSRDLGAAYSWILSAPEIDRRRIGIYGHAFGAWGALFAALEGQVGPAALALSSPPLQSHDLDTLDVPCLLVIGDQDPNFDAVLAAAAGRRDARVEVVRGASYGFFDDRSSECAERLVASWLGEQLAALQVAAH
jgi:predicted phosphoribosyltransferase/alpha/beta superfamily hydrolase